MHLLNLKPCNGQSVSKTFSTILASHKCGVWTQPTSVNQNEFIVELEQRLVDQYVQSWQAELSPEGLNGETSIVQSD